MNSLLSTSTLPLGLPDYAHLTDADFREAVEVGMKEQLEALRALVADPAEPDVENTLHAWEASGSTLSRALDAFWVAKAANTSPERDAIASELATALAAHEDAILLDRGLHDRLAALQERADSGQIDLDEQDRWLLTTRLRAHRRAGVTLDGAEQDRLRELNATLASLENDFDQAVVAGRNAASVLITDEADLAGLPQDEIAALADAARAEGKKGWLIRIVNTTGQPVLDFLSDRSVRERVFRASVDRGLSGEHDTRDLIVRIARLRAERAALLGYPHHAAYEHEVSCAGTTDAVNALLGRLTPGVLDLARGEAAQLTDLLHRIDPDAELQPWDWQFLAASGDADSGVDPEQLKPYLEYSRVLTDGVFAAATALYGITFTPRPDLVGFTEESDVYEVREEDGSLLGGVVIDPFSRPTKRGGAWMTSIVEQSHLFGELPVVTNTLNIPRPAPGAPVYLTWDTVITSFHEFGHALHGLLSDVRYRSCSGTAVPRDFVEFPSQINEMWAYAPEVISRFAVHHETGERIPQAWVEQLVAGRTATAYRTLELLAAMVLDQAWHQATLDQLPADGEGVEEFEAAALERAGLDFAPVPPRYRSTYFSHIFGGGYAAGYYSYMWSEVMDADCAAWFLAEGADGTPGEASRSAGERFRRGILAPGGSIDALETFRRFRGADPDVSHLLRRLGLSH